MDTKEAEAIIVNLINFKFDQLWKGKELDDFWEFVKTQGVHSGGFLITIPMYLDDPDNPEDWGYAWFFYETKVEKNDTGARLAISPPQVILPTARDVLREKPKHLMKSYPVWRYK